MSENNDRAKTKEQLIKELAELKKAEATLRKSEKKLTRLNQCFMDLSPDSRKNIQMLVETAGEVLGAACILYNRLEKGRLCTWGIWLEPQGYQSEDSPEGHVCSAMIKEGKDRPVMIEDLTGTEYEKTDPNVKKYKLKSYLGFPVRLKGKVVGSLCLFDVKPRRFTENEIKIGALLARAVANEEDRMKGEDALAQRMMEMGTFINNIPHMAWLKDSDSNFILANQAFGDAVGMNPEYLRSHTCAVCFGEEVAEKFKEDDRRVMEKKKQITIKETIVDKDGNEVCLETIKSPIFDKAGDVVGTVGIAIDITERKRAEEKLKEYSEKLEEMVNKRTVELKERIAELERFHDATVKREFRIKELREEVEKLKTQINTGENTGDNTDSHR